MSTSKEKMSYLSDDLIEQAIAPLQDINSLILFSRVSKRFSRLLGPKCGVAAELLFCVLNINTERKKRILEILSQHKEDAESIILIRTSGHEFYYNTTICKKEWSDTSPLEAATKCGDIHLVRLLFDNVPLTQKDHAIAQLEGVKSSKKIASEPGSYIYPLVDIRNAFKYFLEQSEALTSENYSEISKELNKRCGLLGDAFKNLSWFLLQVFCVPSPSGRLRCDLDFIQEPPRECIIWDRHWKKVPLNISAIGSSTERALCYGSGGVRVTGGISCAVGMDCGGSSRRDAREMDSLYETLPIVLDKIIASHRPRNR